MFTCHRIVKRSQDGQLSSVGLEWTEGRNWLLNIWAASLMTLIVLGGMVLLASMIAGQPVMFLIASGLLGLAALVYKTQLPGRRRQLVFHRKGDIRAPLGFSSYPSDRDRVAGTIVDVASIEARSIVKTQDNHARFTHGVVLYLRNGGTCYVASRLDPDDAHKVAVQLTLGLNELREDMATGTDHIGWAKQPQGVRQPRRHYDLVID